MNFVCITNQDGMVIYVNPIHVISVYESSVNDGMVILKFATGEVRIKGEICNIVALLSHVERH